MAKSAHPTARAPDGHHPHPQYFSYIPTPTRTATAELLASSAPPVRWVIPDYVGEGLTILAGRQNSGKSWLALDWAIAVASGVSAMGPSPASRVTCSTSTWRMAKGVSTHASIRSSPVESRRVWHACNG